VHVGLGEQDGTLLEQGVDERRIRRWAIALQERRASRGRKADRIDLILENDGQAGKRSARSSPLRM
jgi:hypothetical protein